VPILAIVLLMLPRAIATVSSFFPTFYVEVSMAVRLLKIDEPSIVKVSYERFSPRFEGVFLTDSSPRF